LVPISPFVDLGSIFNIKSFLFCKPRWKERGFLTG
jgi:hypothetical protein